VITEAECESPYL